MILQNIGYDYNKLDDDEETYFFISYRHQIGNNS